MTTRRENLLAVFHHQQPEWIPIAPHIDGYQVPVGLPDEVSRNLNIVTFSRYLGVDVVDRAHALTTEYRDLVYTRESVGDLTTERWETPLGVLTYRAQLVTWQVSPEGGIEARTTFPIEYTIKSVEEMRAYRYVVEHTVYGVDRAAVAARRALVGDDGVVTVSVPASPLSNLARRLMGSEVLAYLSTDYPREFADLVDAMDTRYLEACEVVADSDIDGTNNYDDTSTRILSKKLFAEVEVPYLRRCAEALRARGKFYIHHSCGHMRAFLDDFARAGVDGWDALTAPPDGDVTVAEARRVLGPEIVLMPIVPQTILDMGSLDELRTFVREMYRQAAPGHNFVLWAVPSAGVHIDRFRVLVDEAREWSARVG
ncbi:MAG: hypothetical protein HYY04_15555 [Chloroflexi bacterium]|nr:hypothetical protein [Chloroflexota bacterium]